MERSGGVRGAERLGDLLAAAQYVEQLLSSEHQWLSNRISWLFISQAFCLAAHAVLVTAQAIPLKCDFVILKWAMPVFGVLSCAFVYASVLAARAVAYSLADQRAELTLQINREMNIDIPQVGASKHLRKQNIAWTKRAGGAPHHALPLALAAIWMGLFVVRVIEVIA